MLKLIFICLTTLIISSELRVLDKNYYDNRLNIKSNSKIFDYYDVSKGNIPTTYFTSEDKLLEPYIDQNQPIRIDDYVDQKNSHIPPVQIAPADSNIHNVESYDDYAEESLNKPLNIPKFTVVDVDNTNDEKESQTEFEPIENVDESVVDGDTKTTDRIEEPSSDIQSEDDGGIIDVPLASPEIHDESESEIQEKPLEKINIQKQEEEKLSKESDTKSDNDGDLQIEDRDYYSSFDKDSSDNTTSIISNVDDVMELRTIKPLCNVKTQRC